MRGKKTFGWVVGSLGLLLGAGTAWGNQESAATGSATKSGTGMGSASSEHSNAETQA